MKNVILNIDEIDNEFDFELIGISSSTHKFNMCLILQQICNLEFERENDVISMNKNQTRSSEFSIFRAFKEEDRIEVVLITNKVALQYLISELKYADYLLKIEGPMADQFSQKISEKLKLHPSIQTCISNIKIEKLKDKHLFIEIDAAKNHF